MQASKEQMEKMMNNMYQAYSEMNTMMRETMTASLESVSIMTKGCNEMCDHMYNLCQKYLEQSAKVSQTMMNATSYNDVVDTQNTAIKSGIDNLMHEMSNISQLSSRIAQQAAEPVAKHVNQTMSKLSQTKVA